MVTTTLARPTRDIPFRMAEDGVYEIVAADLFCGAGGTSTGLVEAVEELEGEYGVKIRLKLVAVNHWDVAIATHSANHKFAMHRCSGLTGVQPRDVIAGHLDLLVASPECTHHSNARGGKPCDDQSRSSGDDVVRWIDELRPDMVLIENVREYRSWGPLIKTKKGMRPDPKRRGEKFQAFLAKIRAMGYQTDDRLICCADNGDPTSRVRLFILCKKSSAPIEWPKPTHSKKGENGLPTWETARRKVIDWSDLGKSIFNRKKPLSLNTLRRIEAGLRKFSGIDLGGFLVKLYGTSDVASAGLPLPTVTGGGNHLGLAVPFQIRTDCTGGKTAGIRGIDAPAATVVGSGGLGVVQPFMLGQQTPAAPRSADEPVPTVAARGAIAKVEPYMIAHFGERAGQEPRTHSVDGPVPAVTSRGAAELCQPFVSEYHADEAGKERVRSVDEPIPTVDCANRFGLGQPFMMSAGGPAVDPRSVEEPAHTVLTRDHIGFASPFLTTAGGPIGQGRQPHSVDEPIGTVIGENHRAVIVPVTHRDKEGADPAARTRSVDEPLPTITTAQRGEIAVATAFLVQYNGTADVQSVDKPVGTVTAKPRYALLVTFTNGERCLLDILFRMLRPRELARAQSFPESYQFLGKTDEIVKQIGNAVPVKTAKALCKAAVTQR